ncbi:MAG: outer membrane protein assembly factor BamA [Chthoniobacterales bacterium]
MDLPTHSSPPSRSPSLLGHRTFQRGTRLLTLFFVALSLGHAAAQLPPLVTQGSELGESNPDNLDKLQVTYVGNTAFTDEELATGIEQQYRTIETYGLTDASAFDVGYFLEVFYRMNGYTQISVDPVITGPWSLQLNIAEGPQTLLGRVLIVGFESYEYTYLQNFLLGPLRERFPRISEDARLPFVESKIKAGVELIRRLYSAEGFLDAEIELQDVVFTDADTRANVTVTIDEKTQYTFGNVTIAGNTVFPDEELRTLIQPQTSAPFTNGRAAVAQRELIDYFKKNGYYTANVSVVAQDHETSTGPIDVTFTVRSGPLYRFDGVNTEKVADHVPPDFVRNRLRSLNGKIYSPDLVDKKFRTLLDTGLFTNIRINPTPIPGNELRLDVSADQAKTKIFGFGLGYGTFVGGIASITYTDLNVFGSGRPFSTSLEYTQRGINGDVTYTDPWLFETENELKLRLYAQTITLEGYSKTELGFRPSLTREVTEYWKFSAFALVKYVKLEDILIEPESLVGEQDYSVASIGLTSTLDFRNDPVLPSRGFYGTVAVDFAPTGVGAVPFVRGSAQAVYYLPVTERSNFAFGARGGVISPLGDSELPIDERFFNGGSTTVRSYPELNLGPRDKAGYPLGGQAYTVFNVEYTFPIWEQLRGAVFADAGNVIEEAADFGISDLRYAIGAGLRYDLPVGPIRFDYGFNPAPGPGDPEGAFHFSVGLAF